MSKEYYSRVHTGDYELVFQTNEKKAYTDVENYVRMVIDGKSAIPVDWIKEWLNTFNGLSDVKGSFVIRMLLDNWEEKNRNELGKM